MGGRVPSALRYHLAPVLAAMPNPKLVRDSDQRFRDIKPRVLRNLAGRFLKSVNSAKPPVRGRRAPLESFLALLRLTWTFVAIEQKFAVEISCDLLSTSNGNISSSLATGRRTEADETCFIYKLSPLRAFRRNWLPLLVPAKICQLLYLKVNLASVFCFKHFYFVSNLPSKVLRDSIMHSRTYLFAAILATLVVAITASWTISFKDSIGSDGVGGVEVLSYSIPLHSVFTANGVTHGVDQYILDSSGQLSYVKSFPTDSYLTNPGGPTSCDVYHYDDQGCVLLFFLSQVLQPPSDLSLFFSLSLI